MIILCHSCIFIVLLFLILIDLIESGDKIKNYGGALIEEKDRDKVRPVDAMLLKSCVEGIFKDTKQRV